MNFLVGLNGDHWPTAIPLDRVKELRVDPDWMLRGLATIAKEDA